MYKKDRSGLDSRKAGNKNKVQERPEKTKAARASSMGRRLSGAYTRMMVDSFLSCLILILIVYCIFNTVVIIRDVVHIIDDLVTADNLSESIYDIVVQHDTELDVSGVDGEILLNTFGNYNKPHSMIPVWFYSKDGLVYTMIRTHLNRPDGLYLVNIFKDITPVLLEMAVLLTTAVVLGAMVLLTIFFRGRSMTKNALYPIAEMTRMTKEIKAQNLNLRLNVTNAKDELKELVITFNEMMDRIENAYNKQNQFVSDASHELRTPISVIQGYARMLERWGKEDPEVLAESIEAIRNESENMRELVEKLLFIARNDKDTLNLTMEMFSLSEMMDELVKETRMVDQNHVIESSIEQDVYMNGDRNRIKQAMRIFVDNAQKYTQPGGVIEISLKNSNNTAILSVKDNGCGISAKDLNNIFDRFYRADESRDRNKGGHGLGLSIARIIVLRHGGKIKVKSKPGEGSVFSIMLNSLPKTPGNDVNSAYLESKNP
ncbi:MAG TPA: sensor histidine kinase [Ruminiclostridium sp.]|nr:HAMP domain-containing protein [Clostridiaceae bacterium]HAA26303.1 sensor histidine kinase [Ruminiclostridium sp.]